MNLFRSANFQNSQRSYNCLFSLTALGAGGIEKRTWTEPRPPTMLTLHGKAYHHRIFDLQERYADYNVSNSARFYIYNSEFAQKASSLSLDLQIANTLRTHVNNKIKWAQQYRSAVDSIINALSKDNKTDSPATYIEFAEVSRVNDGPILGENITAPEIEALVYTSG